MITRILTIFATVTAAIITLVLLTTSGGNPLPSRESAPTTDRVLVAASGRSPGTIAPGTIAPSTIAPGAVTSGGWLAEPAAVDPPAEQSAEQRTTVRGTGQAIGYVSDHDGFSWIGSYRLDNGAVALCLEPGKQSPIGQQYTLRGQESPSQYSPDDSARLAYIARTVAPSNDPSGAASAQLAAWMVAGLNGVTPETYARRANGAAGQVLDGARQVLRDADAPGGASRGATAQLVIARGETPGSLSVRADVIVDFLSGGQTLLPANSVSGTISLSGAVFADGLATRSVANGVNTPILVPGRLANQANASGANEELAEGHSANGESAAGDPAGKEPVAAASSTATSTVVRARVDFERLPFGPLLVLGSAGDSVQRILLVGGVSPSASADFRYAVPTQPTPVPTPTVPTPTVPTPTVPTPAVPTHTAPTHTAPQPASPTAVTSSTPTAAATQLANTGSGVWSIGGQGFSALWSSATLGLVGLVGCVGVGRAGKRSRARAFRSERS